jgi:hypothetical protein
MNKQNRIASWSEHLPDLPNLNQCFAMQLLLIVDIGSSDDIEEFLNTIRSSSITHTEMGSALRVGTDEGWLEGCIVG